MLKFLRRLALGVALLVVLTLLAIVGANALVEWTARPLIKKKLADLPHRRVGLVLGCSPRLAGGYDNPFFVRRMDAAAAVYRARKVDYLLLSGDNRRSNYDEPTAMKAALILRGIPEKALVLDYAGFSTYESIVRAQKVFGLSSLCIITQPDHAARAIYIAREKGLDVVAFPADAVGISMGGIRVKIRECLARVRAILDVNILGRQPHFLGPPVQIGGDSEKT